MKRLVFAALVLVMTAGAIACSLNPQPFPPASANLDDDAGGGTGADGATKDAAEPPWQDGGLAADASNDVVAVPADAGNDASDSGDASSDAAADATDSSTDGALDAQGD